MSHLRRDATRLRRDAHLLREPIYLLTDDAKDYFPQFGLAPEEYPKFTGVFLRSAVEKLSFAESAGNGELSFVSEQIENPARKEIARARTCSFLPISQ